MEMAGRRRESESAARTRYVHGRRGEDKEKMDGTWDKNTMIIVCTRDGL